ncbi:hypothetical protein [Bradyrhizobium sp. WSM1743]|uniref:hypothetical protein n=1 Tax=Bradyrhizobium sp. WSM1743 TaxID=318996 RepID=UPI0012ECA76F|nr:hypothetical protein [Bradyrhizobium sp. WSM1743]
MTALIATGSRIVSDGWRLLTDTDHPDKLAVRVFALTTAVITLAVTIRVIF